MTRQPLTLLLVLIATPFACSDPGKVDIGDPIGSSLADYAGNWDGYAELYMFGDGASDRVRVVMDASGQGTIQFGDSPLLPPPTDPNVSYPVPSTDPTFGSLLSLRDDVRYPLHDVTLAASRIRFRVNIFDVYAGWCELQTPVPRTSGGYTCENANDMTPITATMDEATDTCYYSYQDGSAETVNCGKWLLCVNTDVCNCTASSCTGGDLTNTLSGKFDGALDGDGSRLVGTLQVDSTTRVTVRLERH